MSTRVRLADLNWSPLPSLDHQADSGWLRFLARVGREPALLLSLAYLLVGFLGLWGSYWFYRGFDVPILSYLQVSDYLVAGFRQPMYLAWLLGGLALALLVSWPDTISRRHPAQVEALRQQHWVWRSVFARMPFSSWESWGTGPLGGILQVVALMLLLLSSFFMQDKARRIIDGEPVHRVRVHLVGDAKPQLAEAELLGTSAAFVYLWWPASQRVEILPLGAVRKLTVLPAPARSDSKGE